MAAAILIWMLFASLMSERDFSQGWAKSLPGWVDAAWAEQGAASAKTAASASVCLERGFIAS